MNQNKECGKCDNCQRSVILNIKDYTCHARTLVSCLQHMIQFKSKVTVEMLVMIYSGSNSNEVENHKFEQVPEYGQGKGCFKGCLFRLSYNTVKLRNIVISMQVIMSNC